MKHYSSNEIKNLVLVGSSRSGKTTLAECMMFEAGLLTRMGQVEDGNTISDYHEIEAERKHSVYSSILHTEWRGTKLNLIDTPGMDDFTGELVSALRVSDTALMLIHAQQGVEVGTEIAWRYLEQYHKPCLFVVNQMDHPKADFFAAYGHIREQFGPGAILVQYPYNSGEGFNAIIDLLKMVMYRFPASGGKPEKLDIPAQERERADALHNALVEAAAEHDDSLMELYFEKGELDEDEMRKGIRLGMLHRNLFPVFCLSAKRNMGSGRLMGFLGNVAPCAGDMAPERSSSGEEIQITDSETTLFIFKSANEKHTGAMSYFKICSGEIQTGMELFNTRTGTSSRINQLFSIDGKNRHPVNKLSAGDFGATVKLKDALVNDTLRSVNDGTRIMPVQLPEPKIRLAVSPLRASDEEKMAAGFQRLHESDPTLLIEYARELKQTLLHGQGEMHLQCAQWTLEHVYGAPIAFHEPRVPFRETITRPAEGSHKHKKQSGGAGQFAEVSLRIMPWSEYLLPPSDLKAREREVHDLEWGGKLVFYNCIVGGVIDNRFMPAILKGIQEVMEEGPLSRSHARDVAVFVYDGRMHPVDSNEISFKIAGQQAFRKAFLAAAPRLLEPVYRVEVLNPPAYTGEIMTDLQGRRAIVEGIDSEGVYQKVIARVPLAELHRYATRLNALTQGRAVHTQRFLEYAPAPPELQQKMANLTEAEPAA
jgi:elongation factor G